MKFATGEDERPVLIAELPASSLDRDAVGLALARLLAVADRFHDQATTWLKGGGWSTAAPDATDGPGTRLLEPVRRRAGRAPGAGRGRRRARRARRARRRRPVTRARPIVLALLAAVALVWLAPVVGRAAGLARRRRRHRPHAGHGRDLHRPARPSPGPRRRRHRRPQPPRRDPHARSTTSTTPSSRCSPRPAALRSAAPRARACGSRDRSKNATLLRIDFGQRLYGGQGRSMDLSFNLVDPGKPANRQLRVGSGLVTFPVWAFASDGAKGSRVQRALPAGLRRRRGERRVRQPDHRGRRRDDARDGARWPSRCRTSPTSLPSASRRTARRP